MPLNVVFPLYQGTLESAKWSRVFYYIANQKNGVLPLSFNTFDIGTSFRITAGSGLSVNVAEGYALLGGCLVYENGDVIPVPASSTVYIYLEIVRTTNNRIYSTKYLVSTNSNLESQERMLLASVTTSTNSVTSVADYRKTVFMNAVIPVRITTSTSTTLNYLSAKAVYLRIQALGGGGGGASRSSTSSSLWLFGGGGGAYLLDDDLYVDGVQIEVQIGGGGNGGSNSAGGAGGDTIIRVRDRNGSFLKIYIASGGVGGMIDTSASSIIIQNYNYEGISHVSSPSPTQGGEFGWMTGYYTSGGFEYGIRSAFCDIYKSTSLGTPSFTYTSSRFYGGGTGAGVYVNSRGSPTNFNPQSSAVVWGGAGGAVGTNGSFPAGGGGAKWQSPPAGSGAGGQAILDILVFY